MSAAAALRKPVPQESPIAKLLTSNDQDQGVFISHLDRTPIQVKLVAFIVPFAFNTFLFALMLWRLNSSRSSYYVALAAVFGDILPFSLPSTASKSSWFSLLVGGAFDYVLFKNFAPLLLLFIRTHLYLRLRWGFRPIEVVFRAPSPARLYYLSKLPAAESKKRWDEALMKAIDIHFVTENAGYNTRNELWKVHYNASSAAYALEAKGECPLKTWDLSVWDRTEDGVEWKVWEVWRSSDPDTVLRTVEITRRKLLSQGKSGLVAKWDRLRQQQSNLGSPSHPEAEAVKQNVYNVFRDDGINFETLWGEGLEQALSQASQ